MSIALLIEGLAVLLIFTLALSQTEETNDIFNGVNKCIPIFFLMLVPLLRFRLKLDPLNLLH
jgi:hypothetical protein